LKVCIEDESNNSRLEKFAWLGVSLLVLKSRKMREARHVARMGKKRNSYRFLWES
jgi:hypothetical protein